MNRMILILALLVSCRVNIVIAQVQPISAVLMPSPVDTGDRPGIFIQSM